MTSYAVAHQPERTWSDDDTRTDDAALSTA